MSIFLHRRLIVLRYIVHADRRKFGKDVHKLATLSEFCDITDIRSCERGCRFTICFEQTECRLDL